MTDLMHAVLEHREAQGPALRSMMAMLELEPSDAREWFALMRRRYPDDRVVFVYFIQCNGPKGPIKIGIARDVRKRIAHLRIANPYKLVALVAVEAPITTESLLHGKFLKHRIRGEWFRPARPLLKFIEELKVDQ